MVKKTHLWIEDTIEAEGTTIASVTIENPKHERKHLWYRLPVKYSSILTKACDPFVLATLFIVMRGSTDLHVHGEVSPSLLRNLEEFQAAWTCWRPENYTKVEIIADVEKEQPKASNSEGAVVAFSGGVDSCFTTWRHRTGSCGRQKRNIQAGVMIHGFDIHINDNDVFERAAEKSKKILASQGIELIPMATNFRELGNDWVDAHGAAVASCLMMLQSGYKAGLIASSPPYDKLNIALPWGSNPVTDWLMSSDTFTIIHDGASFARSEKVREISKWPEALQNLRVCWEGEQKDRNCGRCEKCIRTILSFRAIGLGLPECFEQDLTDGQIAGLKRLNLSQIVDYSKILSSAKAASISDSWVKALEKCVKQNHKAANGSRGVWQKFRKTIALRSRLRRLVHCWINIIEQRGMIEK